MAEGRLECFFHLVTAMFTGFKRIAALRTSRIDNRYIVNMIGKRCKVIPVTVLSHRTSVGGISFIRASWPCHSSCVIVSGSVLILPDAGISAELAMVSGITFCDTGGCGYRNGKLVAEHIRIVVNVLVSASVARVSGITALRTGRTC